MKIKLCRLLEKWACLSVKWGNACCSGHSLLLKSCGPKLSPALLFQFCWDWFLLKKKETPPLIAHFSRNIPHKCISLESCRNLKVTQIIFWAKNHTGVIMFVPRYSFSKQNSCQVWLVVIVTLWCLCLLWSKHFRIKTTSGRVFYTFLCPCCHDLEVLPVNKGLKSYYILLPTTTSRIHI